MNRLLTYLAGFLNANAPQSSTRLCGILTTLGAITFAFVHPTETASIAAMLAGAAAFFFSRVKGLTPGAAPVSPSDNGSEEKP